MTDDERRRAFSLFEGEIYVRAAAVTQQAARLRQSSPSAEYMADCWLLAESLRSVIRAAEVCLIFLENEDKVELESALLRVNAAVPDAIRTRDALEHFDDYLLNLGRHQQPGYSYSQTYSRGPDVLEVRVGPHVIDVDRAEAAANHLASVVLAGRDYLGLLPDP